MKSTFSRALVGFLILTAAVSAMALVGLRAAETYAPTVWIIPLLIIVIAMITVAGVYGSTLHRPIMDWVKEPAREKERLEKEAASNRK